jgi:antirestriction protein ArdC
MVGKWNMLVLESMAGIHTIGENVAFSKPVLDLVLVPQSDHTSKTANYFKSPPTGAALVGNSGMKLAAPGMH